MQELNGTLKAASVVRAIVVLLALIGLPTVLSADVAGKLCPPHRSKASGCSGYLNANVAGVGTKVMLAALKRFAGSWSVERSYEAPAGMAGRCSDEVGATLVAGTRRLRLSIVDMIRVCTCKPGMGGVLINAARSRHKGAVVRRASLETFPALFETLSQPKAATLTVWIGDRCVVSLDGQGDVGQREMMGAMRVLSLAALNKACSARVPRDALHP
jgi:hypothetical protein